MPSTSRKRDVLAGLATFVPALPRPLDLAVFRRMVDMSSEAFYLTDGEGRFRYVNERAESLTGYRRDELLGMTLFDLNPEFPRERFREIVATTLTAGTPPPFEVPTRRKDGTWISTEASVASIEVQGTIYLFGVVRDLGERKRLETARRSAARHLLGTLEAERQRLARELHDDVGQAVATVGVLLHTLEQGPSDVAEGARPILAVTRDTIRRVTESIARIVRDHHPAELLGLGLEDTLRARAREFANRHKLALRVATVPVAGLVSPEHELHVYRIVQEALTNVVRHAGARRVTVRLDRRGSHLVATVEDDGKGFDPARPRSGGLGLLTMRERAALLGADLQVRSARRHGTTVRLLVPVAGTPAGDS